MYLQPVQNDLADFNYLLLYRVNRFINKVINVILLVIHCLIFSILYVTFKTLKPIKTQKCNSLH